MAQMDWQIVLHNMPYNAMSRWSILVLHYTQELEIPGTNSTIALVFIDTVLLAGKSDPTNIYSAPLGPESQKAADDQWTWINQTLANYSKPGSRVIWKFVAGHYPGMYW